MRAFERDARHSTDPRPTPIELTQEDRRYIEYLVTNDVTVQHIYPSGEVKPHKMTAAAKIMDGTLTYPGPPTLFDVDGD